MSTNAQAVPTLQEHLVASLFVCLTIEFTRLVPDPHVITKFLLFRLSQVKLETPKSLKSAIREHLAGTGCAAAKLTRAVAIHFSLLCSAVLM